MLGAQQFSQQFSLFSVELQMPVLAIGIAACIWQVGQKLASGFEALSADNAKLRKMRALQQGRSAELQIKHLQQVSELKILVGALLTSSKLQEFTATSAGGNIIRSFMRLSEKLAYIEARFMNVTMDEPDAMRQVLQSLNGSADFEQMVKSVSAVTELWVSARQRFGELPHK